MQQSEDVSVKFEFTDSSSIYVSLPTIFDPGPLGDGSRDRCETSKSAVDQLLGTGSAGSAVGARGRCFFVPRNKSTTIWIIWQGSYNFSKITHFVWEFL